MALQPLESQDLSSIDISQKATRLFFILKLFPERPTKLFQAVNVPEETFYQSYFAAIQDELGAFDPKDHVITTVNDLLEVLDLVRKNFTKRKNKITESVVAYANSRGGPPVVGLKKKAEASVEFAVKWWLLADFQRYTDPAADRAGDAASRPWPATRTLGIHTKATICDDNSDPLNSNPNRRFSRRFTLYDMDYLRLIKIKWTNSIAQHLYLEEWKTRKFHRTVYVFSHTALMETLIHDPRILGDAIREFLAETMDTVDLLLDLNDPEAKKWYRKLRKEDNKQRGKMELATEAMDLAAGSPKRENSLLSSNMSELRRVGHYKHWQQRLLKLEKAFDESKPTTLRGWWRDRRNTAYWATFLSAIAALVVAFVAVLFTLASVVTAPMSVMKADEANSMAKDGKALAEEANSLARLGLVEDSDSPGPTGTTEAQSIVIVVQHGCCGCAECETGDGTETGAEETLIASLTTEHVADATTCATSIGN